MSVPTAAAMRDFITLQRLSPQDDARFGNQQAFQQYAQVWAQVLPQTGPAAGTEQLSNQGVQTVLGFTATMRFRSDVKSTDRIIYRGQTLEVLSVVDPDGLRRTLEVQAKAYAGVQ